MGGKERLYRAAGGAGPSAIRPSRCARHAEDARRRIGIKRGRTGIVTPSVIVPLPRWTSLGRQCLGALMATLTSHPDAEVLLVAEPTTVPAPALAALGERVHLVPITGPFQFAAACNEGAAV